VLATFPIRVAEITNTEKKMKRALIIYGTTTGNTQEMSEIIKQILERSDLEIEMKNVTDAVVDDLIADHDVVLLGCPAYGDDTVELQEDFENFYEQLDGIELNGKKFAVFAPGDSSYEHFCGSVDMLEEKMDELGGKMAVDGLKIDGDPGDAQDEILEWSEAIAAAII
jgi:flavodoxin short chain